MRSFLAAVVAACALTGGAVLPAHALTGANLRDVTAGERSHHDGRLQLVRYADDDDDDGVRPSRRWRMDDRLERPRHAAPRHARSARKGRTHAHAGKQRHEARRSAHRVARTAARSTHRAAAVDPMSALVGGMTGMASFYWEGQRTATGERFNPEGMTAAHRTLPFGTRVRVTHLGNGRTVDVRINDRGPFIGGRIIDLSRGAAGVLGMQSEGVARVKVTVLGR
jgi:rare lipoprotein A